MTHDNKTVLLVDDPDILEVIRDRLICLGYSVLTAHDGYEVLEISKRDLLHGVLRHIHDSYAQSWMVSPCSHA